MKFNLFGATSEASLVAPSKLNFTLNFRSSLFVQKGRNINVFIYENLTRKDLKGHFLARLLPAWVRYPKTLQILDLVYSFKKV